MSLYRVANGKARFENNRTKELKVLGWVPIPNGLDTDGYTELIEHGEGAAHWGVWIAIVCVASRCTPRWSLVRDDGRPHDAASLARILRVPRQLVEGALPRLLSIGWLENGTAAIPQEGAAAPQDAAAIPQEGAAAPHRKKERKEEGEKGRRDGEKRSPLSPPTGGAVALAPRPEPADALAEIFGRRSAAVSSGFPGTEPAWSHPDVATAVKALGGWNTVASDREEPSFLRAQFLKLYSRRRRRS